MTKIETLQARLASLYKKQSDIESLIQKNQAKKEVLVKQLKDDFGIEEKDIDSELAKLSKELEESLKNVEAAINKFSEYLTKIEAKLG